MSASLHDKAGDMPQAIVDLKPGRDRSLRRRHPWVFSGAVARITGEPASGDTVCVRSHDGEALGVGSYSPSSQIRVRMLSFEPTTRVDEAFLRDRLHQAIAARRRLGLLPEHGLIEHDVAEHDVGEHGLTERNPTERGACRLVFSESDGIPGLIVDRYAAYLVCQFLSAGAERWRDCLLDTLERALKPRGIFERSEASVRRKEGLPSSRGLLRGLAPTERIEIESGGLRQLVDIAEGQKTGAYLDQRDNRQRVAAYARGARVLDAYAYSGGFALSCLRHGAGEAVLLDSSEAALRIAAEQAELNGLAAHCRYLERDVGKGLRELAAAGERFDLIVLDPPKFVHSAEQIRAGGRAYKDINRLAFTLLNRGGLLASFSCSGHVDAALFAKIVAGAAVDAGRDAQILERLAQPADHPVSLHLPESEYLKGLVLRVFD